MTIETSVVRRINFIRASAIEAFQPAIIGSSLIYLEGGITPQEVGFLKTMFLLTTVAFDVPTSAVAKIIGSEAAFFTGKIIHILALVLFAFCLHYGINLFYLVEFLFGAGSAFILGLRSTIACEVESDAKKRVDLVSNVQTAFYIFTSCSFLFFLARDENGSIEANGLIIITLFSSMVSGYLIMKNHKTKFNSDHDSKHLLNQFASIKIQLLRLFSSSNSHAKVSLTNYVLLAALFIGIQEVLPPFAKTRSFDFGISTLFLAFGVFASALGAAASRIVFTKNIRNEKIFLFLAVIICVAFIVENQMLFYSGMILIAFTKGLLQVRLFGIAASAVGGLSSNPLFHSFCNLSSTIIAAIVLTIAAGLNYSIYLIPAIFSIILVTCFYLSKSEGASDV